MLTFSTNVDVKLSKGSSVISNIFFLDEKLSFVRGWVKSYFVQKMSTLTAQMHTHAGMAQDSGIYSAFICGEVAFLGCVGDPTAANNYMDLRQIRSVQPLTQF